MTAIVTSLEIDIMGRKNSKESIHSGHFMVSDFEAEAQDEEGLEVPDQQNNNEDLIEIKNKGVRSINHGSVITYAKPSKGLLNKSDSATISIDGSLTKLLSTMTLAYRQNITSPKWNRFKGLKLRWKDRLRLNNVIWRCWHLQFIKKKKMTVCQFALDVDIHNKAEAVVLEGKYWKRRLAAVTAEYRKWRVFYKNVHTGKESLCDPSDMGFFGVEDVDIGRNYFGGTGYSLGDGDLPEFDLMDVLFSPSNSNQGGFHFPNPREIARGTENSDLLQPCLMQLQPDLPDDLMDFHEMLAGKVLPTVPEEEYFPDVEAAGLPPPSPPTVSTPHTPILYNVQLTATPQGFPGALIPTQQTSTLFSSREYIVNQHSPPSHQHQPLQDLSIVPIIPQELRHGNLIAEPADLSLSTPTPLSPQSLKEIGRYSTSPVSPTSPYQYEAVQQQHPVMGRSQSQHELDTSSTGLSSSIRQDGGSSFVVPKSYSRQRSHSGSISLASAPAGSTSVISATSVPSLPSAVNSGGLQQLVATSPALVATVQNSTLTQNVPTGLYTLTHALKNGTDGQITRLPSTSPATLLAHLLPSEPYSTCQSIFTPTIPSTIDHIALNKVKTTLPLVLPRIAPDTSSRSNSSSSLSSINSTSSTNSGIGCRTSIPNIHLVATQPSILSSVALSPVTPSSIKSLHSFPQVSSFSASAFTLGGSSLNAKMSPPHPESSPPHCSSVPSPPNKSFRPKSEHERHQYKEHRRVCHINAEQKRRCNIKNNFETLHSLIPYGNQSLSAKVSKATMLHKGAEYIQQLKEERKSLDEQAKQCKAEIDKLSLEISTAQSLLPATGAPITHSRHNKFRGRFQNYTKEQTLANWKFYIFSLVVDPLLESYNNNVSTGSVDDLCRSSMAWLDQHCSLNVLRPIASNAMRKLSTSTSVLAAPDSLPEEIYRLVMKQETSKSSSSSTSPPSTSFPSSSFPS